MNNITAPSLYEPDGLLLKKKNGIGDFSLFERPITNTKPLKKFRINDVYELLVSQKYATFTHALRKLQDKERARRYKACNFDFACISGIFTRRCEAGLVIHSNMLTIDFDDVEHVRRLMHRLINNSYFETVLAFVSPSGNGVKWIIKIDLTQCTHLEWFKAIQRYVWMNHRLAIDQTGKGVVRCCFCHYDPSE